MTETEANVGQLQQNLSGSRQPLQILPNYPVYTFVPKMPDYNKLTVVKLREELVRRGLTKTGLKPVLVNRLQESDAQSEIQDATPDVPIQDAHASQGDSHAQFEPSQSHVQDSEETEGIPEVAEEPDQKPDSAALNGPLPQDGLLDEASENMRENEHSLNVLHVSGFQSSAVVHEVVARGDATPGIQALSASQPSPDANDADLSRPKATDITTVITNMGEEVSAPLRDDKVQKSSQATNLSQLSEQKTTQEAPGEAMEAVDSKKTSATETSDKATQQRSSKDAPEGPSQVSAAEKESHTALVPENEQFKEGGPEGVITATQASQQEIQPVEIIKKDEERQEEESTKQPHIGKDSEAGSDFQDDAARHAIAETDTLEENRKRKRRSQSPPLLSEEVAQKRARIDESKASVVLPEDSIMQDAVDIIAEKPQDASEANRLPIDTMDTIHNKSYPETQDDRDAAEGRNFISPERSEAPHSLVVDQGSKSLKVSEPQSDPRNEDSTPTHGQDIAAKMSPQNARFKKLFGAPPDHSTSPAQHGAHEEHEDRSVSPALHPATSALYIRDFMRPLHPSSLKDHLVTLATSVSSSSSAPSPSPIITDFFLDPIRTHCLVGFTSIAAASRVRSSLHNRVWPDERDRRPLWVDFVPEEKLQKWIDVEKDLGSQRGQPAKRWEVVYEEETGEIKAYLQEAGSGSRSRPSHPPLGRKPDTHQPPPGVAGAPLGPRARAAEAPRPIQPQKHTFAPEAETGRGFRALDDLFQSTAAKPKLYYLPVSKAVVDKRLGQLGDGKGSGRGGNETRKYTFEGEVLVDRGPEFSGRGRGGFGGGRRGRGGHRGEGWRDRARERDEGWEREEGNWERARREAWREKDRGDAFRERERERPGAWRERDRDGGWRGHR